MSITFAQKVYALTRRIPKGKVTTYSAIAKALKIKGSARAVGNALNKNPFAPKVPCHRVVRASGEVGGFASGPKRKQAVLKKEGIIITQGRIDLNKYGHQFKIKS